MSKFGSQSGFYKSFSSSPQLNYQLSTYEWRTRRFDSLEIASLKQNEIGNPEKINLIFETKSKSDETFYVPSSCELLQKFIWKLPFFFFLKFILKYSYSISHDRQLTLQKQMRMLMAEEKAKAVWLVLMIYLTIIIFKIY